MVISVDLYHDETLLAAGTCSLGPDHSPTWGTMTVPEGPAWFTFERLKLNLADGRTYWAAPLTVEPKGGGQAWLTFDIREG